MNSYILKSQTFRVACEAPSAKYEPCTNPRSAVTVLRAIFATLDESQEHFIILALNSKGRVVGHKVLSSGSATACLVSPEMFFRAALVLGGTSAIACHNHPSGDPGPSHEDQTLTRRLQSSGDMLGLPLSDHLILGDPGYYSFRASEGWDR